MFFRRKSFKDKDEMAEISQIQQSATLIAESIQIGLKVQDVLILYEEIIYYFFLVDVALTAINTPTSKRENLMDILFSKFNNELTFRDSRVTNKIITQVFNNRMQNYAKILYKNNGVLTKQFFKDIHEYQTELIASIVKDKVFSMYNPCPENLTECTPKCLSLLLTSTISAVLVDSLKLTMDFLDIIYDKK